MKFIGITGGIGAGKSVVLDYLDTKDRVFTLRSDAFAAEMEAPGTPCYRKIREAFPEESLYNSDGSMNRRAFSAAVFADPAALDRLNAIVHPAVREGILADVADKRAGGETDFYFLEAALLLEGGYDRICDEIWYVTADPAVRRERLKESRGYSDDRIDAVFASQLSDAAFREKADVVIENNGDIAAVHAAIDRILLGERLN